jgi:hypothetical protein
MLDIKEYEQRATSRLALIEAMDKRCQWDKFGFQVPFEIQELRRRREKLMDEQTRDEIAAGL